MFRTRLTSAMIVLLVLSASAAAETVTWTVNDPLPGPLSVVFASTPVNVTGVTIRTFGYGGGQRGWCEMMEEPWGYDFWLPFTLAFSLDGAAYGSFPTPLQAAYDSTAAIALAGGQPDWTFLEDGRTGLEISVNHGFEFDMIHCLPMGYESLTIEQLTLTVTCEAIVPTETMTFGTVKALYR